MGQTSLSVWFVCRLCRGSFGQVDAFIEHKKQKHFNEFQNTTSIVFQESELGPGCPVITSTGNIQIADEGNELPIKIEVNDEDRINPCSSEIMEEPNLGFFEPKSELITYEYEINADSKNNLYGLKQPEQNPYVLLKRLTSEEIQSACVLPHNSTLLKCKQKNLAKRPGPRYSLDTSSKISDHNEVGKCTENQQTANAIISKEHDLEFECKLCSKQLPSIGQLKIHVGICALYHEDRKRFCVTCNRKFCKTESLKEHRLRFHGTEEEKSSLYKYKCHLCPKKYQKGISLTLHLDSHRREKEIKDKISTPKPLKCSYPNCGSGFRDKFGLQRHIATHFDLRPFSCSFPKCNKKFSQRGDLNIHLRRHTGERPYICTVDNCNEAFITSGKRTMHQRRFHCYL